MLRKQELSGIRNGYEKNIKIICDTVKYGKTIKNIGVCSPSYPGTFHYPKRYSRGIEFLKNKGFVVTEGILTQRMGYRGEISGNAEERAYELNQLIPKVDIILSSIGGYNSNSMLSYIDYDAFKQNNTIFVGYSDTTAIALAIYAKTGCVTYMSQCVISTFGEFKPFSEINFSYFELMFDEKTEKVEFQMPTLWTDDWINWENYEREKKVYKNEWRIFNKGVFEGVLIGGNLDTIIGILGTEYMPCITKKTILLLEDTYTDLGRLHRNFTTLSLHGVFDEIGGLIISKFENIEKGSEIIDDLIKEFVGHRDIPILLNFDCGHTHPSFLMPIGGKLMLKLK